MRRTTVLLVLAFLMSTPLVSVARPDPTEPDYTKGETLEKPGRNFLALGPTGAHGYVWATRTDFTKDTRMILIKSVDKDTPADGKLQTGDVILGIGSNRFQSDVRKALSAAVTKAEKEANGGRLVLNIWRSGKTMPVELRLPVMGSQSATSPWNCEKSEAIIQAACDAIMRRGWGHQNQIADCLDALGLLATGDKQHWPLVRKLIETLDEQSKREDFKKKWSWYVAYDNVLLCEYYLTTKDATALPIIELYANRIAMGTSGVGTWGHLFADPIHNEGKPFGRPNGYGAMNQVGLTCTLSLVLAQKCGVNNKYIDWAVKQSSAFLSFYVDKGVLPYGDHDPGDRAHDNNGVCSQAAVLFDLLGNKKAASFFTRMTLASYNEREIGHTGHFFGRNWGPLGAARGGAGAAASFSRNIRWFTELERRHGGGFFYQPQLANIDHNKYTRWSTTGSQLLHHCLPRKQLHITGKGGSVVEPITGKELRDVVAAATLVPGDQHTIDELLAFLGSWSPKVRVMAATELNKRDENLVDRLIAMLDSRNEYVRYGACTGLRLAGRGSEKAVRAIVDKGLHSDSMTMRYFAIQALTPNLSWQKEKFNRDGVIYAKTLGPALDVAFVDLVKAVIADYPDEARPWTHAYAGFALFGGYALRSRGPGDGLLAKNMAAWRALEIKTRVKVLEKLLQSDSGNVRSAVGYHFRSLSDQELANLMPAVCDATRKPAVSGVMFGWDVRNSGTRIMAEKHIKEGMEAGMTIALGQPQHMDAISPYGQALKPYFPKFEDYMELRLERFGMTERKTRDFVEAWKKIRETPAPKLMTIEEFQNRILKKE